MLDKAIIDLSHWDEDPMDFRAAKRAGVVGILHKATESNNYIDPTYEARREQAEAAGLLWGAYHFLRPGDMHEQAEYFVSMVGDDLDVYAADHEDEGVSLARLKEFLLEVEALTGKKPIIYSGHVLKDQLGDKIDPDLAQYRLWLAQYTEGAPSWPPTFECWWLWQYTEHGDCAGIPGDSEGNLDLNRYDGTVEQLQAEWTGGAAPPQPDVPVVTVTIDAPPGVIVKVITNAETFEV